MKLRRGSALVATAVVVGLALTGCGSKSLGTKVLTAGVKVSKDASAAALVPQAIKDKGTLVIGTDATYAPSEFLAGDGKSVQGFDVDLFRAVAEKLGLKTTWQPAAFDSIITGVKGGKYTVGVSSFSVNADRLKQVNMVSYFSAGTSWAAAAGNPKNVDPNKPCGLTVAVQKGTTQQEDDLPSKVTACKAQGKPIKVLVYTGQDQATSALVSGKADAMLADSPVVAYAVKQANGKIAEAGSTYDTAPYGYQVPKNDLPLANAILAALKSLNADGSYAKILKYWGVDSGAITDFAVNPAL